jgi:hypothetical protein
MAEIQMAIKFGNFWDYADVKKLISDFVGNEGVGHTLRVSGPGFHLFGPGCFWWIFGGLAIDKLLISYT